MRPARRFTALAAALIGALAILALPSLAAAKDRNHDRIPDRWEKQHRLSTSVNQARRDQDKDHLRNRAEFLAGDNPRSADSDGDGIPDGSENAGTIASFDTETGKLTIDLFGGETISGLVDEGTEIECGHEGNGASASSEDGQGSGQDQQGEEEQGDNQTEEEPGDDDGGEAQQGDDGDRSGSGSPSSGEDDEGEGEGSCTTADLVVGTVVQEADLKIANGAATFEKVELGD
jgi:hypothetical protein